MGQASIPASAAQSRCFDQLLSQCRNYVETSIRTLGPCFCFASTNGGWVNDFCIVFVAGTKCKKVDPGPAGPTGIGGTGATDLDYLGVYDPAKTYNDGEIVVGPDGVVYMNVEQSTGVTPSCPGVRGIGGGGDGGAGATFEFTQASPSPVWRSRTTSVASLGDRCRYRARLSIRTFYNSLNVITITFGSATSGKAYCAPPSCGAAPTLRIGRTQLSCAPTWHGSFRSGHGAATMTQAPTRSTISTALHGLLRVPVLAQPTRQHRARESFSLPVISPVQPQAHRLRPV
jgi:hypothetical protein